MKNIFKYSPGFLAGVILSSAFAGAAAANSNLITDTIDELWVFVSGDPVLASQVNENFEYLELKIDDNFNAIEDSSLPSGTIVIWSGDELDIPFGWSLCDGTNGTPDMRGQFVVGANNLDYLPNSSGGNVEHSHGWYSEQSGDRSGVVYPGAGTVLRSFIDVADNLPPYIALFYIQKD